MWDAVRTLAVLVALAIGTGADVLSWLAVAGILTLFTLGLTAKTVDGASAFSYPPRACQGPCAGSPKTSR